MYKSVDINCTTAYNYVIVISSAVGPRAHNRRLAAIYCYNCRDQALTHMCENSLFLKNAM